MAGKGGGGFSVHTTGSDGDPKSSHGRKVGLNHKRELVERKEEENSGFLIELQKVKNKTMAWVGVRSGMDTETGPATKGGGRALPDMGRSEEHHHPTNPTMIQNLDWSKCISLERNNLAQQPYCPNGGALMAVIQVTWSSSE